MWKTRHVLDCHAHPCELMYYGQGMELSISFNMLETMLTVLQYLKVWAKNIVYKFVRTYWSNMRLKVKVPWIVSLMWMRHVVATTKTAVHFVGVWVPYQRKSPRYSLQKVKWCALPFMIEKGWSFWSSWDMDKPSTLTAKLQLWLCWKLKFPVSEEIIFLLQHGSEWIFFTASGI